MDDITLLDGSVHLNRFEKLIDFESEENADVMDNLVVSWDGTIMAVKSDVLEPFFSDKEVKMIRMGWAEFPKSVEIKSKEDFYRVLAMHAPLSED